MRVLYLSRPPRWLLALRIPRHPHRLAHGCVAAALCFSVGALPLLAAAEPLRSDSAPAPGLVDAAARVPGLMVDLKYATTDNFMKQNVYGSLRRCFLRPEAAAKLAEAARELHALRPDLRLLAYDCARPLAVQEKMWRLVRGTPSEPYVADPRKGSMHNFGCAVDLTLADKGGRPLDLGTPYDAAGARAQPRQDVALLKTGQISSAQLANRLLLRLVMVRGGFFPLDIEWWHFDCALPASARRRFKRIP
jgi:D-alanyl-D-alanine dipeptidase